jgi:hypothetical protein
MVKNTLLILLISLFVTGCNYNCPGFDKDLLVWMPYETGDELVYTNQQNDTLKFTINQKEISEPYETSHKNRNHCHSYMYFEIAKISQQTTNMIFRINELERKISIGINIKN